MKTAKRYLPLFILALTTQQTHSHRRVVQRLDGLLKQYYAYGQLNGAILVAEKGKIIYEKGFGMAGHRQL